jgi:Na+-translocating ferredoxin:NAD+ oxidoreductase RnfE subunit
MRDAGWRIFDREHGLLIALLPPGAFVLLGLMLALGNARSALQHDAATAAPVAAEPELRS